MQVLTNFLVAMFEGQPVLFMLALVVILLVTGSAIDNGIQTIVFLPLLMPSVRAMGVDDMQFAMIFILAGNLSLITPPLGSSCSSPAGSATSRSGPCSRRSSPSSSPRRW